MKGNCVNVFSSLKSLIKRKAFCVFMTAMLLFLTVPSELVFANSLDSNNQESQVADVEKKVTEAEEISEESLPITEDVSAKVSEKTKESTEGKKAGETIVAEDVKNDTITISGTVKAKETGQSIPAEKAPYVLVAGWLTNSFTYYKSQQVMPNEDGSYSITGIPSDFVGVATAGAEDFTNAGGPVLSASKIINFELKPGANCYFSNSAEGLSNYVIKAGSYLETTYAGTITLPDNLPIGLDIPRMGVQNESTFTADLRAGTITYHYYIGGETIHLVLGANPQEGKTMLYWSINDKLALGTYKVDLTQVTDLNIAPHFCSEGKMDISGSVKDTNGNSIKDAYAMVIGYDFMANGALYISELAYTNEDGKFAIKDQVPNSVIGVVYVGAAGCTNQIQFIYSDVQQLTDFILNPGAQCTFNKTDGCKSLLIKARSKLHDDITGIDYVLDHDIEAGSWFPPIGFPFDSTVIFNPDGTAIYKYSLQDPPVNGVPTQSVEIILQAVGNEGLTFQGWQKNGEDVSGEYHPNSSDGDFSVAALFGSSTPTTPVETITAQTGDATSDATGMLAMIAIASLSVMLLRKKIQLR